jgi:succinoglycan biosynthesis transport protein ExoP
VPFIVQIEDNKEQLADQLIQIKFLTANEYQFSIPFETERAKLINYQERTSSDTPVQQGPFTQNFKMGQKVTLPFLNWTIQFVDNPGMYIGKEYFVR